MNNVKYVAFVLAIILLLPLMFTYSSEAKAESFSISTIFEGKNYTITGQAVNVKVLSFDIIRNKGIDIKVEAQQDGEVEVTLPRNLMDFISHVDICVEGCTGWQFEQLSTDHSSTSIRVKVPAKVSVIEIWGSVLAQDTKICRGHGL